MDYMKMCYVLAGAEDGEDKDSKLPAISSKMSRSKQSKLPKEAREYVAQRARCCRRVPHYVMLMGLPGSGKSTFARALAASAPSEWTVVS
jgi:ABC-type proline/glycine betaine transport system ATPase subunit